MDSRAAKLALARKKLKDHQGKKVISLQIDSFPTSECIQQDALINSNSTLKKHIASSSDGANLQNEPKSDFSSYANTETNITEILISNKRNMETQITELQTKLVELESEYAQTINNFNISRKQILNLESELKSLHQNYMTATRALEDKDSLIKELNDVKKTYWDNNNNLAEQLEFTKTMLTAKETENASLQNQLAQSLSQLDGMKLQLHQLTSGSSVKMTQNSQESPEVNEVILQKISFLEQQLKTSQKERDQISIHYEHYVAEINEQLKAVVKKNEELSRENEVLSNRESSLVEQLSDLEIRLQNFNRIKETASVNTNKEDRFVELQQNYANIQEKFQDLNLQYEVLKQKCFESETIIKELREIKESDCKQDDISLSKLQADMASDKVAAQRATEQNKKLKNDLKELEEAFVKMSKDKLELTEKIAAEKFLNRELTIKLADVEENAKNMDIKLKAKDDEMIRLQNNLRTTEKELEEIHKRVKEMECNESITFERNKHENETENNYNDDDQSHFKNESKTHAVDEENNCLIIKNDDAMTKLQDRFLKIMGEVADLSDEKHRLEHIILQLQNETDTICEYVALYQQQRSLLKKRDEERNTQIKIFQDACSNLQNQIEELNNLLVKFAEDKELSQYLLTESRKCDLEKVISLISNLKNNCLIDPKQSYKELKNFYPCSCCSGNLIEV